MKQVKGFKNYYITKDGKVWSNNIKRFMKYSKDGGGYKFVQLFSETDRKHSAKIHRLVAEAFIPNPFNYSQVNHKDGNKENNNIENLEWCDCATNIRHAWKTGLCERSRKLRVERKIKKVLCLETKIVYNSAMEAGILIGMRKNSIPTAIYKRHKCKGMTFQYV